MITSPGRGESEKFLKGVEVWCRALKMGGWQFSYLIFSRFIILHLKITLPFAKLCHAFAEKKLFFYHHNFMKKGHSKVSKNEPENIP